MEQARGDPNAWQPLENSDAGMASKALDTGDATANTSGTRWVFSAAAGSPDKHSGVLGATDIILDVPMHVAAAGGRRGSRSGGVRRTGDDAECGGVWSGAGEEPAPALAAVDDGIDSSSDGSGSMSSGGLECAAQRAIEHAAVAGDDDDDDDEVIDGDSEEAEITAALFVDELINTFDGGGETAQRRVPDSIAGFGSLLRQNGVRRTVWLSMAHLVDGVVGAVMDDADVAREAAASVAEGVRTTAAAGRATIATIATRSTELRQSWRRTAHRATMRRNTARQASGSSRRSRKA